MLVRVRGDLYPIEASLSINGEPVNLTNSVVRFGYIKDNTKLANIIIGVVTDPLAGKVRFQPTAADFKEAGEFTFDIEAVVNDIPTTYKVDRLRIKEDVSK